MTQTMPVDPVALAQALIRCPSVTPHGAGTLDIIETLLREAGFKVDRPVFEAAGTSPIENLYARIGAGGPVLAFAGHVDVVPPGDASGWSRPPFSGDIADGKLWGRGAADMKGGLAASMAAILQHMADHGVPPDGALALLITGDEEGPAVNGTVKLLHWAKERGERFGHCVLGEPTSVETLGDTIKIGRRGSLTGHITVKGRQGHVAYPHLAENPIPGMARLIDALAGTPIDAGTAAFDPSTLAFTTVDVGNPASNVVPDEARATFNIRFNTLWSAETLAAEIAARLEKAADGSIRFGLRFEPSNADAFLTEPGRFTDMIADAIETVTGARPRLSTSGGTSDARFIKDYCPVVECGIVGKTMHQIDEYASTADIEGLTRIYRRLIERYFEPSTRSESA